MNRSFLTERKCSRKTANSLQFERLEERIALTVDVSGEVFWDANRNGLNDDILSAPESISVSFDGALNAPAVILNGASSAYFAEDVYLSGLGDGLTGLVSANLSSSLTSSFELTAPLDSIVNSSNSVPSTDSMLAAQPSWVETADLDGQNGPDLIVTNFAQSLLTIMYNDGSGGFSNRVFIDVPANPTIVLAEDLNGDNYVDLVVGNLSTNELTLFINDGFGQFDGANAKQTLFTAGNGPFSLVATDINGDGKIDLAVNDGWNQQLSVFLNQSVMEQVDFVSLPSIDTGGGSRTIVAADLQGQPGRPSLLVLDDALNEIRIFDNDGNGNFSFNQRRVPIGSNRFMVAGQLDEDPYDDLVFVGGFFDFTLTTYFGDGDGGLDANAPTLSQAAWTPRGAALADMDNDGDLDIVSNLIDSRRPSISRNEGGRQFSSNIAPTAGTLDSRITTPPALADFNRDGVMDIAYAKHWLDNKIIISFRQLQAGEFGVLTNQETAPSRDFGVARVVSPTNTTAGDYDGDGNVNGLDLEVWKANFGRTAGPGMSADSNGSNRVDGADFLNWQRNFGNVVVPVQALAETAAVTVATEEDALEEAVAIDANIAWLASANVAFSTATPLRTTLTETQLKDAVFSAEAVSDFQPRAWKSPLDEIRISSQSREALPRLATIQSPIDSLLSDLDLQELAEGL